MEFKLVYGRSGSGKTSYVFDRVKEKIDGDKKIYIVVPEQFSFSAEKHLLDVLGGVSSVNAEVLTLSRMADRVIETTVGNGLSHLSSVGKSIVVYDVIDSLKGKMNFLSSGEKNLELAGRMITEFKKHSVSADVLSGVCESVSDRYLRLKLEDAERVMGAYQERIESKYIDESDCLEILAENIEKSGLFDDSIFYIDEFAGFTPNEYIVIEKLCSLASGVTVTVCTDSVESNLSMEDSLFYFNTLTAEKILEVAKREGAYIERIDLGNSKRAESDEIRLLEKNIYDVNNEVFDKKTSDISIFVAKNPESEIRNVAKIILDLVRDGEYRYRDFAVVCANIDTYSAEVKSTFEKFGIPVFIDENRDVNNNILVKYIVSLLNILTSNFSYEAMFSYLKSGVLDIEENDVFVLENYINKWGIRGKKWILDDFSFEEKNDVQDRVNELRRVIVLPILEFWDSLKGERSAKSICENLYNFIQKNGIQDSILRMADEFEEDGKQEIADEYRNGVKIFFEVLDEIVLIFDDEKMNFDRFNRILQVGISQSEFGAIPASFDQVLVGDVARSRTSDVKGMFLIGLNDGVIPSASKDEGFFNDSDREVLKEMSVELAKNSLELLYDNQYNIYKVLSMAKNRLYLSYPVSDSNGKVLRSSILVTQIKKIFPFLSEKSDVIEEDFDVYSKDSTLDYMLDKYQDLVDGVEIEDEWKDIISWYEVNEAERIGKIFRAANFTNVPEVISGENVKKLYGSSLRTSVSRLEQYQKCPFSFHMKYGLKLKEEDVFKIRALDTGNFMHEVIDEFFSRIEDDSIDVIDASKEELYKVVSEIINQKLGMNKNYIFNSSPKFIALTKRLKNVVFQSMEYIIDSLKNSKFKIYGHELEFSEKSKFKPMRIDLGNGREALVTGKIDRVDVAKIDGKSFVRIIDYKSSLHDLDLNQVVGGLQIQLLTYLDEVAGQMDFEPTGVFYFNLIDTIVKADKNMSDEEIRKELNKKFRMKGLVVSDLKIIEAMDSRVSPSNYSESLPVYLGKDGEISRSRSSVIEASKFERLQKYTKKVIADISREILSGKVDIKPFYLTKKTGCDYCEYKSVCNFDTKFKDNDYRYIKRYSKDFIFDEIINRD